MPRALFVHASSDLYGSDLACLRVAEAAVGRGWDVEVTVPWHGPLVDELRRVGAGTTVLDPLKPRRADLRAARLPSTARRWLGNARAVLQKTNAPPADVVYTTTAPTLGGVVLARRWRARHVYHVHELFWFPGPLLRGFERILRQPDVVVCCSAAVRDQFHDDALRRRAVVAHTGADVEPGLDERTPLTGPAPLVICVARLNEWKGQEVLVEAIGRLRTAGHDIRLDLVGDVYREEHHYRTALEAQIAGLGLGDAVRLLRERRDAAALVAQADIFVLPSRRPEPFGMALVEAMALGRPVVATDAGGPREILTHGEHGLLAAPGDAAALADAIESLLRDPSGARAMAERGRVRAGQLTTTAMVDAVLDAFGPAHQSSPSS